MRTDELAVQLGLAFLQEKLEDFAQVAIELIERFGLRVSAGKARDVSHVQSGRRVSLDDGGKATHVRLRFGFGTATGENLTPDVHGVIAMPERVRHFSGATK
jgi:hypothetical protein